MSVQKGKYPNTFYRVSLKAIIRNERGEVLLVRENSDTWGFPGGGIDHGETEIDALRRELHEEVAIVDDFEALPIGIESYYIEKKEAWLMWVVYEVKLPLGFSYGKGADADEVVFMDPKVFAGNDELHARLVYKWAVEKSPH